MKTLSTKRALFASMISLLLCVTMLVGSTFAWFTDTATASVNTIQAGTLDVALEMKGNDGDWVSAEGKTLNFLVDGKIPAEGTKILWEPGCTYSLPELRVVNSGNLALKYKVVVTGINGDAELNDAIEWTIGDAALGTTQSLAPNATAEFTISGHMKETAGNAYQGKTIDGISITVIATQDAVEYDSNGNTYDENAEFPVVATATVTVDANGKTTEEKSFVSSDKVTGSDTPVVKVTVPADVKLADGKTQMTLTVSEADEPYGFTVGVGEFAKTYEISIPEVATDNTEKIKVQLHVGTGLLSPVVYHKGVEMDPADYSYDSVTGIITISTATFSPFTVVNKAAAVINDQAYLSLDTALADVKSGDTLRLTHDYTGNLILNGKDFTLDFNGYTVYGTLYIGCTNDAFTSAKEPSAVVFKDETGKGGVTSTESCTIIAKNGSKLTIDGGNYVNEYAKGSNGYSSLLKMVNCELTVNGGYLHNNAQVGNYNRVIDVESDDNAAKVTINGGKFEGTQKVGLNGRYGSYSYLIASHSSDDTFDVEINGGEFLSHTSQSYLTQVYGNVVVNDCTFTAEGCNSVFDIPKNSTVTVKGGTFSVNEKSYTDTSLAGLIFHRKSNGWTSVSGTLLVDPAEGKEVKVNQQTYSGFIADGATQSSAKDTDGFYTISR